MMAANKKPEPVQVDIAIIGAGLVGATVAALLGQSEQARQLSILLIDQGDPPRVPNVNTEKPEFDPRVVALTPNSIGLMQELGLWSALESNRTCSYTHMTVWDSEGTGRIDFDARELRQARLGAIVENSLLLNAVLVSLENCSNVQVLRGHSIARLANDQQYKRLWLDNGITIDAKLIVAADGGQSKIRDMANLPVRSWSYQHQAIVTSVECEHSHQHTAWQNFLATGPLAFLPLGEASNRFCSIVWSAETHLAEELMKQSDDEFKSALAVAMEHRFGSIKRIDQRHCFPLLQRHAIRYYSPQLALVGDAAHTIHPLAGQGVNLGLLDAQALVQEINRALQRDLSLADISILRRYQRQRKRHNLEIMLLMEGLKRLFSSRTLASRWLRNAGLTNVNKLNPIKNWLASQAMGLRN